MRFVVTLLIACLVAQATSFDQILDRSNQAAEREANFLASVACTESLTEVKLGPRNRTESKSLRLFDYFVLVDTSDGDFSVNESRIEQNKQNKAGKALLQSTGFALLDLVFHPFFQQSFSMTDGGMDVVDGHGWQKVLFRYRPGKRSPTLFRTPTRDFPISWSGTAWVDSPTGKIGKIDARADAQLDEIGIKSMEATVRYGAAANLGDKAEWVPLEAVLDVQTPHQHWRNIHTFSKFRKFEVTSTEERQKAK